MGVTGTAGTGTGGDAADDREAGAARFTERFALLLANAGMSRMPARVFARLLATDSGRLTAAELAERLQVSPAAISGAVRYLDQVGLVHKAREPGERRDHYTVSDDLWYEVYANKDRFYGPWADALADSVEVLGPDTPAGRRLDDTRRFFLFMQREVAAMFDRWRASEAERRQ